MRNVCRTQKCSINKKPKHTNMLNHSIEMTKNVERSKDLENENGGTFWKYEKKKEVDALMDLDCFESKPEGNNPGEGWKCTNC